MWDKFVKFVMNVGKCGKRWEVMVNVGNNMGDCG